MYLILTLQVPFNLPIVFSKTDSVFLKEDTFSTIHALGLVSDSTTSWECTGWYKLLGMYCAIHALEYLLRECTEHLFVSFSHSQTIPGKSFGQDAFR